MKLVEIARLNKNLVSQSAEQRTILDEAIAEAELVERKAKAFDWLSKHNIQIDAHGFPSPFIFRGSFLEGIEMAMKEKT